MVSVIIPVYNVEKYLDKCIKSVLRQTYTNLEVILVDDGSPDHCPAMCDEYQRLDQRIKVIHKQNGGLSSARNAGIDAATGEWLCFIDSDDYIDANMIKEMLRAADDYQADLVLCNFHFIKENGEILQRKSVLKDEILSPYQALEKLQEPLPHYYVIACNKLYKRSLFDDIRFPEGKRNEDQFIMHKIFCKCRKIRTESAYYYYYVQSDNSIMRRHTTARNLDDVEALCERAVFYREHMYDEMIPGVLRNAYDRFTWILDRISYSDRESRRRFTEIGQMLYHLYRRNRISLEHSHKLTLLFPNQMKPIRKLYQKRKAFILTEK